MCVRGQKFGRVFQSQPKQLNFWSLVVFEKHNIWQMYKEEKKGPGDHE